MVCGGQFYECPLSRFSTAFDVAMRKGMILVSWVMQWEEKKEEVNISLHILFIGLVPMISIRLYRCGISEAVEPNIYVHIQILV